LVILANTFCFALDRHGNDSEMPAEVKKEIQLEIAHVLFIDVVGYSKLSINEQHAAVEELDQIVRASEQLQTRRSYGPLTSRFHANGKTLRALRKKLAKRR
jgi:hypothetical protein